MCIKREPHEILQPVADLVAEVPQMMRGFATSYRAPASTGPHLATIGTFPGLQVYYGTLENV